MSLSAWLASFILRRTARRRGFSKVLDRVKIISVGWGKCVAELRINEEHTNGLKMLHNGMLLTMFDVLTSFAMVSHPKYILRYPPVFNAVSLSIHMKYFEEVSVGEKIILEAHAVHCGKTMAFVEAVITNGSDGSVVAKGTQYFFLLTS